MTAATMSHPVRAVGRGDGTGMHHHDAGLRGDATSPHPGGAGPHPRSAHKTAIRPGGGAAARTFETRTGIKAPRIVAWEITRRCNLHCAHCRAWAEDECYQGELSLEQCKAVIDDIARISDPILILTGGEPLLRDDIWEIIDYAHAAGLHPVIGTNGTLIDDDTAARIYEHGISRISVSLDFPDAEGQDRFRGKPGAFDETISGIRCAERHGIGVQVNTTITKMNRGYIEDLHDLSEELGAVAFHPFLLVPTGRGEELFDVELTPDEYEEVLTWAYHRQKTSPMHFKPTDAPQYYRIIRQMCAHEGREVTPETYGMEALTRGCLGGITFCFISHTGDVQPCGYFDMQLGNVLETPFSRIWEKSPVFDDLRHYDRIKGKCGACEYRGVCGGCRARALAATGDYLSEEPYCSYIPGRMLESEILDIVQSDFPLTHAPFESIAGMIEEKRGWGVSPTRVSEVLGGLVRNGAIRRVGALFNSHKLGYVSTLCAVSVPDDTEEIERVASIVNSYPGVTHNYLRNHEINVWFTLIAHGRDHSRQIIAEMEERIGYGPIFDLPAEKIYKLRVDFGNHVARSSAAGSPLAFDAGDPFSKALVRWADGNILLGGSPMEGSGDAVQSNLELLSNPYAHAAELLNDSLGRDDITEGLVIDTLLGWKGSGVIRRFGALVNHRKIGYSHNIMTVWDIDDASVDAAGGLFAEERSVSHCYARPRAGSWHYNLYAMVHAKSPEEAQANIERLRDSLSARGIDSCDMLDLESTRELKKVTMAYFCES